MMRRRSGGGKKSIAKSPWLWSIVVLAAIGAIFGHSDAERSPQQDQIIPGKSLILVPKAEDGAGSATEQSQGSSKRPKEEELQERASTYLSEQFDLDLVSLEDKTQRYEIRVTAAGASDREDHSEAPENWEELQLDLISAQARTTDELGISTLNTMLYLVDQDGGVMLSVRNGKIIENRYKNETAPGSSDSQSSERTVWVTGSGKKYHFSSSCSNMSSPRSIPISEARAKGYTACDKCA